MPKKPSQDPLGDWLSIVWNRPERSYNPELKEFFSKLLGYPGPKVITEDEGASGYPDLKLLSPENIEWIVGDLKKGDDWLTSPKLRGELWKDKQKYVDGLTRYVVFITANYVWIAFPNGTTREGPFDLRGFTTETLREKLDFISFDAAAHHKQWRTFISGGLPYSYLKFDLQGAAIDHLRADLSHAFGELSNAADHAIERLAVRYADYQEQRQKLEKTLDTWKGNQHSYRRAFTRLDADFVFERRLFGEALEQFTDQYGRDIGGSPAEQRRRIREAFSADSVAALVSRVLFLRLLEDLNLTKKRRLTNGGPKRWSEFVEFLTSKASMLIRVASEDLSGLYSEPFRESLFDWIQQTNGALDAALQRLILRLNAYDFSGLSEEILGDVYQQFLPPAKRKRLGEFYTPPTVVDWILEQSFAKDLEGRVLDPACGSGSFIVRALHDLLEDAKNRALDIPAVCEKAQQMLWGFDLNPFASFISHFQLMWGLLRYLSGSGKSPSGINVYNLNSLQRDDDLATLVGKEHLPAGAVERDTGRWKYVVGNPPYIRAERVKYGDEMKETWKEVWGQNADAGLLFLYRSMKEWLVEGGLLGMVVSGGYANSEAAARIWRLLHPGMPGSICCLRKVVWLEFAEKNGKPESIWDVARVPMILIIERKAPTASDEIELYVPPEWPTATPPTKVTSKEFFDAKLNPKSIPDERPFGDYLLPLLVPADVEILQRLQPDGKGIKPLSDAVRTLYTRAKKPQPFWWTYGIQRGGVDVTLEASGKDPIPVIAGRTLAIAWPGEPAGWIDMKAVNDRPNGKPSLWADVSKSPKKFLAVPTLCRGLSGAVISASDDHPVASLNNTLVALPRDNGPSGEAIAAYLNSALCRFYWMVCLRAAVIQGYYSTIYPRILDSLPWPANFTGEQDELLKEKYNQLGTLCVVARNNPINWLLSAVEGSDSISLGSKKFGVEFNGWQDVSTPDELTLDGNTIRGGLLTVIDCRDSHVAELVYTVLTAMDSEVTITSDMLQKFKIPKNLEDVMTEYRTRRTAFQKVEGDFHTLLSDLDEAVFKAFAVDSADRVHIESRLAQFPLNRLKPRYPWEVAKPRPIKAYMVDRFE